MSCKSALSFFHHPAPAVDDCLLSLTLCLFHSTSTPVQILRILCGVMATVLKELLSLSAPSVTYFALCSLQIPWPPLFPSSPHFYVPFVCSKASRGLYYLKDDTQTPIKPFKLSLLFRIHIQNKYRNQIGWLLLKHTRPISTSG